MNAGSLDTIVQAFASSLQQGGQILSSYSLGILAFAAIVAWTSSLWPILLSNQHGLATALLLAIRVGVFYWISTSLAAMALAAFHTFLGWGTAVGGGSFSASSFLSPSTMLDYGFVAAKPIQDFLQRFSGMTAIWNMPTVLTYIIAFWIVVLSFVLVVFHLVITIVEFHMAVMAGAVLIPWGALSATAFLSEFAISWIIAGLIRVLLTAAILSIAIPLFSTLALTTTPGGDPTLYSAMVFAATAFIFAILAWQVPARAAAIGGRGMALGLTGGILLPSSGVRAAQTAGRAVATMGGSAITGASRLLAARRG